MDEINLDDAKIKIDGEWLSTEDLARKIEEKMQSGDMKFSHLATALEELNKAIENTHTIEVKLTISNQDYEKLKAFGGKDDQEAVRKATLSFIKGRKQPEPPLPAEATEAAVEEPVSKAPLPAEDTDAPVKAPAEDPSPMPQAPEAPVEEADAEEPDKDPDKITVVNCFKCKSPIDITTDERPVDIKCPNCDTTGRLDSNNKMEPRHQDHFLG